MKKSYTGLVVWLVLFMAAMGAAIFLPAEDPAILTRLIMNLCTIGCAVLTLMIWRMDRIYWYTGMSFEEAAAAEPQRRGRYAKRHFVRFGCTALLFGLFSVIAQLIGIPIWVDIVTCCVALMAVAFSTIGIQL